MALRICNFLFSVLQLSLLFSFSKAPPPSIDLTTHHEKTPSSTPPPVLEMNLTDPGKTPVLLTSTDSDSILLKHLGYTHRVSDRNFSLPTLEYYVSAVSKSTSDASLMPEKNLEPDSKLLDANNTRIIDGFMETTLASVSKSIVSSTSKKSSAPKESISQVLTHIDASESPLKDSTLLPLRQQTTLSSSENYPSPLADRLINESSSFNSRTSLHVEAVAPLTPEKSMSYIHFAIPDDDLLHKRNSKVHEYSELLTNTIDETQLALPLHELHIPTSKTWVPSSASSSVISASPENHSPTPLPPFPGTTTATILLPASQLPLTSKSRLLPLSSPSPSSTLDHLDMPAHVFSLFTFLFSPPPSAAPFAPPINATSSAPTPSPQDILALLFAVPQGCLPPQGFSGGNYMLSLTPQAGLQYGAFLARVPRLYKFTLCLRFQVATLARSHFLFSYAVSGQDNAILVFVSPGTKPGLGFYVNNVRTKVKVALHVRTWYSTCMTWDSKQGRFAIYLDGVLVKEGDNQCPGCHVDGGGVAILGLEQDRPGGGFNPRQVTHGHVTSLYLKEDALHPSDLHPYQCCSLESAKYVQSPQVLCHDVSTASSSGDDWVIEWGVTPIAVMGGALFVPINL